MGGPPVEREILHVNTDDFYASVLRLRDPTLRGKALVVAGPPPRGVVFSSSYEARGEGEPRAVHVADLTGDGYDDLLLIAHDRLLLYPGQ